MAPRASSSGLTLVFCIAVLARPELTLATPPICFPLLLAENSEDLKQQAFRFYAKLLESFRKNRSEEAFQAEVVKVIERGDPLSLESTLAKDQSILDIFRQMRNSPYGQDEEFRRLAQSHLRSLTRAGKKTQKIAETAVRRTTQSMQMYPVDLHNSFTSSDGKRSLVMRRPSPPHSERELAIQTLRGDFSFRKIWGFSDHFDQQESAHDASPDLRFVILKRKEENNRRSFSVLAHPDPQLRGPTRRLLVKTPRGLVLDDWTGVEPVPDWKNGWIFFPLMDPKTSLNSGTLLWDLRTESAPRHWKSFVPAEGVISMDPKMKRAFAPNVGVSTKLHFVDLTEDKILHAFDKAIAPLAVDWKERRILLGDNYGASLRYLTWEERDSQATFKELGRYVFGKDSNDGKYQALIANWDKNRAAVLLSTSKVQILDLATGKALRILDPGPSSGSIMRTYLAASPDFTRLLVQAGDKLSYWNVESGELIWDYEADLVRSDSDLKRIFVKPPHEDNQIFILDALSLEGAL